jgi:GGDEF domain-containing protein
LRPIGATGQQSHCFLIRVLASGSRYHEVTVISLKQSLDDYDQMRTVRNSAMASLLSTVEAIGNHALEVDAATVQQFRNTLSGISERLRSEHSQSKTTKDDIDGALRDFHKGGTTYIDKIRSDLGAASDSLRTLLATFQRDDTDVEKRLGTEITHLRSLQQVGSLDVVREGLKRSTVRLGECAEELRREKDTVITQLKSEIQTLQQSLDHARRAETLDVLTHVRKKEEFIRLLRREAVRGADIGVIQIRLRNLHQLAGVYPASVIEELVSAFSKRMENVVPPDSISGRWANDVFCVLVPNPLLRSVSAALVKSCAERYVCTQEGVARKIEVITSITSLSRQKSDEVNDLLTRLGQMYPL